MVYTHTTSTFSNTILHALTPHMHSKPISNVRDSKPTEIKAKYRIYQPIRRTFFPKKCDLNSTCILCAEGKYYFQTYKYPYIYYTTSLSWDSENSHEDDFSGSDDDFLGFYDE